MSRYIIAAVIFILASTGIAYAGNESQGHDEDVQPTIINPCDGECQVTPTTNIEVTGSQLVATVTPTVSIEATLTPMKVDNEVTPTPQGDGRHTAGDGLSDHKSDGSCSKPPCVTPGVSVPKGAPNTSLRQ